MGGGGGTLQGGESKVSRKVAVQLRLQNGEPKASSLLHGGNGWSPEGSTARAASWQSSLSCCTAWSTCQQGALPTAWRSAPLHVAELRPWWRRREWNPRGAPSKLPGACSSLILPGCQELLKNTFFQSSFCFVSLSQQHIRTRCTWIRKHLLALGRISDR